MEQFNPDQYEMQIIRNFLSSWNRVPYFDGGESLSFSNDRHLSKSLQYRFFFIVKSRLHFFPPHATAFPGRLPRITLKRITAKVSTAWTPPSPLAKRTRTLAAVCYSSAAARPRWPRG